MPYVTNPQESTLYCASVAVSGRTGHARRCRQKNSKTTPRAMIISSAKMHRRRRDAGCIFILASTAKVRSALFDIVGVFDGYARIYTSICNCPTVRGIF